MSLLQATNKVKPGTFTLVPKLARLARRWGLSAADRDFIDYLCEIRDVKDGLSRAKLETISDATERDKGTVVRSRDRVVGLGIVSIVEKGRRGHATLFRVEFDWVAEASREASRERPRCAGAYETNLDECAPAQPAGAPAQRDDAAKLRRRVPLKTVIPQDLSAQHHHGEGTARMPGGGGGPEVAEAGTEGKAAGDGALSEVRRVLREGCGVLNKWMRGLPERVIEAAGDEEVEPVEAARRLAKLATGKRNPGAYVRSLILKGRRELAEAIGSLDDPALREALRRLHEGRREGGVGPASDVPPDDRLARVGELLAGAGLANDDARALAPVLAGEFRENPGRAIVCAELLQNWATSGPGSPDELLSALRNGAWKALARRLYGGDRPCPRLDVKELMRRSRARHAATAHAAETQ